MSTLALPHPDRDEFEATGQEQGDGADHSAAAGRRRTQQRPRESGIPTIEECLRALAQVPGLVAMGILEPAQANAIRSTYREILLHHKSTAKETERTISNADVMDLLRKSPKVLDLLTPLLTPEQLDMIMAASNEEEDG